jgi:uncharacterized membrane protein
MRSRISALPLALAFSLCAWQSHAQETYTLTKIEGLTFFGDLNNKGVVVGATRAANGAQHAAVWERGRLTDIHDHIDSNAVESDLRDVNDKLDMVGTVFGANFQGFLLSGRRVTRIGPLPGDDFSFAFGLNDRRQVIGNSSGASGSRQFVWQGGRFTILEGLTGQTFSIEQVGIQDRGIVAGSDNLARRAVIWQNDTVMDIGGLPGSSRNLAGAINDRGQVAGQSILSDPDVFPQQVTAFIWKDGVVRALPPLFDAVTESHVTSINNHGVVVGESLAEGAEEATPTIWQDGAAYDLNQLIDPNDPLAATVTLDSAGAINDLGQIVAVSNDPDLGVTEFYLLTPVR